MRVGFFAYNKLFTTPRPRVLIVDEQQQVFLVKHWGSWRTWSIPGGGAKRGESPDQAARRELREEIGITVSIDTLRYVTTVVTDYPAPIFLLRAQPEDLPPQPFNQREITAVGWFSLDNLPTHLTKPARLALSELAKNEANLL